MAKTREQLKLLLVQMREDESKAHEVDCIVRYSKLAPEQLDTLDTLTTIIDPTIIDQYDGVIIGGANAYRVSHDQPEQLPGLKALVQHAAEQNMPLLGLCYGAHLIASALGGTVEFHPERKEVTTVDIYTLDAAKDDVMMHDMPQTFKVNCGRTDDIVALPENAVLLAKSDLVENHAFRIEGKPIYATQFHAELGQKEEWDRMDFAFAFSGYFKDVADLEEHKATVEETPEATVLLEKFIDRVVLPKVNGAVI